jgi:predicted GNAT superfamily acetyltransferase
MPSALTQVAGIVIRPAESDGDYAACEGISREIWGSDERNNVPRELLKTIQLNGGIVLGAFHRARLVGFVFGLAGLRNGKLRLCSHQLGVLHEYRGLGLGLALKEAQRRRALELGYQLMTWTFDPLEARNAYLNLHRLGAVAASYHRNHYGDMDDDLNRGLPSDRFEVEWHILQPHQASEPPRGLPVILDRTPADEPRSVEEIELKTIMRLAIGVPPDFQAIKKRSMELAFRWRLESRLAFERSLEAGFIGVDFDRRESRYVFQKA